MKAKQKKQFVDLLTWIREGRQARKMTLRETAAALKVPPSWVGKAETGDRRLDVVEYVKLCEVLGLDPLKGLKMVLSAKAESKPATRKR
jgi:transcriptional regulator with XRE-family HTH domain